jgi:murein DD-endopeptidase MepM/ murein hydrolase activator NlpD
MSRLISQLITLLRPKFQPVLASSYLQLKRPYPASRISKLIRPILEKRSVRNFLGINLVTAMLVVPGLGSLAQDQTFSALDSNTASSSAAEASSTASITTDTTVAEAAPVIATTKHPYIMPIVRIRYLGQDFHPGHPGWDINSYVGDPVMAFSAGKVIKIEAGFLGFGRHIVIDHGDGLTTLYAHLKAFKVTLNQMVKAGDQIGEVGMTGWTTGPHLHFEIHEDGIPVSPGKYLKQPSSTPK